jgi:hypothetical protein
MFLCPRDAAKLLSERTGRPITLTTLRNWRTAGRGPKFEYFNRKWPIYRLEALEAYLQQSIGKSRSRPKSRIASVADGGGAGGRSRG